MAIARWNPRQTYTKQEEWIMRRLGRTRKLFAFLRAQRHALFDEGAIKSEGRGYRRGKGGSEGRESLLSRWESVGSKVGGPRWRTRS
jgi:hypothetical protein